MLETRRRILSFPVWRALIDAGLSPEDARGVVLGLVLGRLPGAAP